MDSFVSDEQAAAWLAAFIDGEGCVYVKSYVRKGRTKWLRLMTVTNTELDLIEAAAEACDLLGITYTRGEGPPKGDPKHKYRYWLEVQGQLGFRILRNSVPMRSTRKVEKLDQILATYTHSPRGARNPRVVGTCDEEGCEGVTGIPGTARGKCRKHYYAALEKRQKCVCGATTPRLESAI